MMNSREKANSRRPPTGLLEFLTPREREVLAAVVKGLTNRQIGELLGISHRTVEVHRARLMRKLGVDCVAQLVALYVLNGVTGPGARKRLPQSRTI
ncbi:response regulator transcription factor [Sphingobium sp.]|uniref:response regulator transcription factor n=1 Tax=Sphingobium sp. TaxID=1912891 RepID=UPI0035C68082